MLQAKILGDLILYQRYIEKNLNHNAYIEARKHDLPVIQVRRNLQEQFNRALSMEIKNAYASALQNHLVQNIQRNVLLSANIQRQIHLAIRQSASSNQGVSHGFFSCKRKDKDKFYTGKSFKKNDTKIKTKKLASESRDLAQDVKPKEETLVKGEDIKNDPSEALSGSMVFSITNDVKREKDQCKQEKNEVQPKRNPNLIYPKREEDECKQKKNEVEPKRNPNLIYPKREEDEYKQKKNAVEPKRNPNLIYPKREKDGNYPGEETFNSTDTKNSEHSIQMTVADIKKEDDDYIEDVDLVSDYQINNYAQQLFYEGEYFNELDEWYHDENYDSDDDIGVVVRRWTKDIRDGTQKSSKCKSSSSSSCSSSKSRSERRTTEKMIRNRIEYYRRDNRTHPSSSTKTVTESNSESKPLEISTKSATSAKSRKYKTVRFSPSTKSSQMIPALPQIVSSQEPMETGKFHVGPIRSCAKEISQATLKKQDVNKEKDEDSAFFDEQEEIVKHHDMEHQTTPATINSKDTYDHISESLKSMKVRKRKFLDITTVDNSGSSVKNPSANIFDNSPVKKLKNLCFEEITKKSHSGTDLLKNLCIQINSKAEKRLESTQKIKQLLSDTLAKQSLNKEDI